MVFAQNVGDGVVGTYEGHLLLSEGRWGGDSSWILLRGGGEQKTEICPWDLS